MARSTMSELSANESSLRSTRTSHSAVSAREIAAGYADRIDPISDNRGSAAYRTRMIAVEVRRALDTLTPVALTPQVAGG